MDLKIPLQETKRGHLISHSLPIAPIASHVPHSNSPPYSRLLGGDSEDFAGDNPTSSSHGVVENGVLRMGARHQKNIRRRLDPKRRWIR